MKHGLILLALMLGLASTLTAEAEPRFSALIEMGRKVLNTPSDHFICFYYVTVVNGRPGPVSAGPFIPTLPVLPKGKMPVR